MEENILGLLPNEIQTVIFNISKQSSLLMLSLTNKYYHKLFNTGTKIQDYIIKDCDITDYNFLRVHNFVGQNYTKKLTSLCVLHNNIDILKMIHEEYISSIILFKKFNNAVPSLKCLDNEIYEKAIENSNLEVIEYLLDINYYDVNSSFVLKICCDAVTRASIPIIKLIIGKFSLYLEKYQYISFLQCAKSVNVMSVILDLCKLNVQFRLMIVPDSMKMSLLLNMITNKTEVFECIYNFVLNNSAISYQYNKILLDAALNHSAHNFYVIYQNIQNTIESNYLYEIFLTSHKILYDDIFVYLANNTDIDKLNKVLALSIQNNYYDLFMRLSLILLINHKYIYEDIEIHIFSHPCLLLNNEFLCEYISKYISDESIFKIMYILLHITNDKNTFSFIYRYFVDNNKISEYVNDKMLLFTIHTKCTIRLKLLVDMGFILKNVHFNAIQIPTKYQTGDKIFAYMKDLTKNDKYKWANQLL
jgi:hypothetical protein